MLLGLTGSYCSGKDTVAEYLVQNRGFLHYSLSDELRYELQRRKMDTVRENLIAVGTELRTTRGNGVLAELALKKSPPGTNGVITSIRHPAEIEVLQKRSDFILINVDAPAELRFQRMLNRKRPGDPDTFASFLALEQRESQTEGSGQQLAKCAAMAQRTFCNDADTLENLHAKIDALIVDLRKHIS